MNQLIVQRILAVIVGLVLVSFLFVVGVALMTYDPMIKAMQEADGEWAKIVGGYDKTITAFEGQMEERETPPPLKELMRNATTRYRQLKPVPQQSFFQPEKFEEFLQIRLTILDAYRFWDQSKIGGSKLGAATEGIADAAAALKPFNDKALAYNDLIKKWPNRVITKSFRFLPKPSFPESALLKP